MTKIVALILFIALFSFSEGSAIPNGVSAWVHIPEERLQRVARSVNLTEEEYTNTSTAFGEDEACLQANMCSYSPPITALVVIMSSFQFKNVSPQIDLLCGPRKTVAECWAEFSCPKVMEMESMKVMELALGWICNNRTGFRDAAQCFENPFAQVLTECSRHLAVRSNRPEDIIASSHLFRFCGHFALEGLTSCSEEDRRFFFSFFDFIITEQVKRVTNQA